MPVLQKLFHQQLYHAPVKIGHSRTVFTAAKLYDVFHFYISRYRNNIFFSAQVTIFFDKRFFVFQCATFKFIYYLFFFRCHLVIMFFTVASAAAILFLTAEDIKILQQFSIFKSV